MRLVYGSDSLAGQGEFWDAVVIGAGPSGAVTAYRLGVAGFKTLLVDRRAFPRFKVCGGCLSAGSLRKLQSIGLGSTVAELPGVGLSRVRIGNGRGPAVDVRLPTGMSVSRRALDTALVDAALDVGVRFVSGVHARVQEVRSDSSGTRSLVLRGPGVSGCILAARVVVAADGLGHPSLAGLSGFGSAVERRSYIGAGTVFAAPDPEYQPGTIYMAVGRAGYVGAVRVEGNALNLAAALDPAFVRQKGGVAHAVIETLSEAGFAVPDGLEARDWSGTPALTQRAARTAAHRVLVVGDAAGYVEPFTGEGISRALSDASAAGPLLAQGIAAWTRDIERTWERRRFIDRGGGLSRVVREIVRSRSMVTLGIRTSRRFPGLATSAVRFACKR